MAKKFTHIILFILLVLGPLLGLAQDYTVKGVVFNQDQLPIGGISLSVNGSTPVISTPKEGRFQVQLVTPPNLEEWNVSISNSTYHIKHTRFNYAKNQLEISIQPIFKTLGGWVRTLDKKPISGVVVKFKNASLEKTAITDRDGFFRIQLASETPVTIADFIVEAYTIEHGNVELRKVKDNNLKFIEENTFVFLNVTNDDPLVEVTSAQALLEATTQESTAQQTATSTSTSTPVPIHVTQERAFRNETQLKPLVELIETRRGKKSIKGSHSSIVRHEIEVISQELGRLQEQVNAAVSKEAKEKAESAFTAYMNDAYIADFIEYLRKVDPDNPLVILLEKYRRDNIEILNAKQESDFQLGVITRYFQASMLVAISFFLLGGVALYFALSNYQKKKKLQEAAQKLEQERRNLEVVNEELKTLTSIVAHDLKSPLNKVLGIVQLIPMVGSLDDEQKKLVGMVTQVAKDGRMFIENLLDIKAIEEQKRRLKIEPLEINEWIRRSMIGYEQTGSQKNIDVYFETNAAEAIIDIDKSAFGQVMDNLVSNAIKFSPEEKNVHISVEVGYALVSIAIRDEGPGISAEDQQRMFKKFQRLSAKPTGGEHSSGLGLSIVKMLVEQMKGEIQLQSQLDQGSTFTVYFHKHTTEEIPSENTPLLETKSQNTSIV